MLYCVGGGQLVWAANGNTNFRMPSDQQHPTGFISFQLHHTTPATSYCVAGGQLAWAANGNTNFRMPPDHQHPVDSISFQLHRTTPVGLFALPAATEYFDLSVGAVFMGASGNTAVLGSATC
eukprot:m51a1_g10400 hypothetical protein (122) ;mRNA; r:79057-84636